MEPERVLPGVARCDDDLATLKANMRAAQAAHAAVCLRDGRNTPAVIDAARVMAKAEAAFTLAKLGRRRLPVPAGRVECGRCGGYGGHYGWPGFVCFDCGGHGHVEASGSDEQDAR
jgi:hypothetical protein